MNIELIKAKAKELKIPEEFLFICCNKYLKNYKEIEEDFLKNSSYFKNYFINLALLNNFFHYFYSFTKRTKRINKKNWKNTIKIYKIK